VIKNGNRAASSLSGGADTLEALGGASFDLGPDEVARSVAEVGISFAFARNSPVLPARLGGASRDRGGAHGVQPARAVDERHSAGGLFGVRLGGSRRGDGGVFAARGSSAWWSTATTAWTR
jgi:anthranilate phosphoribosyltransferase